MSYVRGKIKSVEIIAIQSVVSSKNIHVSTVYDCCVGVTRSRRSASLLMDYLYSLIAANSILKEITYSVLTIVASVYVYFVIVLDHYVTVTRGWRILRLDLLSS
mmetsp:Transcript_9918/g.1473  ORF Transcript_9918/g.1473 Transcript_9918/m.1473 type:complete len:104 (-) Transcript_9918:217-528(-)